MKALFLFLFFFISSNTKAHEYYFAFAEVEYNIESHRFEGTIVVTTHDLEALFKGNDLPPLEQINEEEEAFTPFKQELQKGFKITVGNKNIEINFIGHEVFLSGITEFYFESEPTEIPGELIFTFSLMMDEYQDQQNKIEYTNSDQKYFLHFYGENKTQLILSEIIENEE